MRTEQFHAEDLVEVFRAQTIVTMADLKQSLGTTVDATVFRKLREIAYRTSYSHRASYYTLDDMAEFNQLGLWSFRSVWFSIYGTLMATVEAFVNESETGCYAADLESILHVGVKDPLRKLTRQGAIWREKIQGRYLYCSVDRRTRKQQLLLRSSQDELLGSAVGVLSGKILPDELKAAIVLFFSLLDEKQRRLYVGLESLRLGHGGDQRVAEIFEVDVHTVAKGRRDLLARDVELDRVRKRGGGRKAVEKKRRK